LIRHAKRARPRHRQLGQFLTPAPLAREILAPTLASEPTSVLEPSFGEGAFLIPVIEHFMRREPGSGSAKLGRVLNERVWGVEIDASMYERTLTTIRSRWGPLPSSHNLSLGDYFRFDAGSLRFDAIVGNPPFGGTFDPRLEDALDRRYGRYRGSKVKKETYSFFIAKALDELAAGGALAFICSDTFLTIKTMAGLRMRLMDSGQPAVTRLGEFSEETSCEMVTLRLKLGAPAARAMICGQEVRRRAMEATGNYSWTVSEEYAQLFNGSTIGDLMVATGGMTIGRNELFVRAIADGEIEEPLRFSFDEQAITLESELKHARLGKLSARQREDVRRLEEQRRTRRVVVTTRRRAPLRVRLPHADYRYYNKAASERLYAPPSHVVYWKDEGDAVLTFKKSGPWYLRGVGGGPYFGREGLTWQLVAPRIKARYLPEGYILDSGAPCAFLRDGVSREELWLILGWLQTPLATSLLKDVINHTRNIQGKDIERLPYPWWVRPADRLRAAAMTENAVRRLQAGEKVGVEEALAELGRLFDPGTAAARAAA
jgi:Eco57I restriction-modification methylase